MAKIIVIVDGGLVQSVIADEPGVKALIIDCDERDDERIENFVDCDNRTIEGYGCEESVHVDSAMVNENFRRNDDLSGG